MSNLTTVGLTGGVPTSGTGTVSTIDNMLGTAGSPNANVLSVQGVSGGTAVPVSGTVTTNDGGSGGTGISQPSGGSGLSGWLSGIYNKLSNALLVAQSGSWTVTSNDGGSGGTGISQPSGGSGLSGWLSGIFNKLSNALSVTQSGTWTVQPGNTANTTPWLATVNQGGNSASVTSANALKVDGSAVTQPVSGASGSFVDGAVATIGAKADSAATSPSSSASVIAALKGLLSLIGSATGGAAASISQLIGGIYNSTPLSLSNGQQAALQLDSLGGLLLSGLRPIVVTATFTPGTSYGNTNNVGGLVTLSFGSNFAGRTVILDYINVAFGAASFSQAINLQALVLNGSPSTTLTDGSPPNWASADAAKVVRAVTLGGGLLSATSAQAVLQAGTTFGTVEAICDSSGKLYVALADVSSGTCTITTPGTATVTLGARY
jgi:Flp pilus assembly pilin Flp